MPAPWWAVVNAGVEMSALAQVLLEPISRSEGPLLGQADNDELGTRRRPIPVRLQICGRTKDLGRASCRPCGRIFIQDVFHKVPWCRHSAANSV